MARPDPWRKIKIIKIIAAMDIMIATFSIFYNGKTIMVFFGTLDIFKGWIFFLLIFCITFGIHITQIILAVALIKSCHECPTICTNARAIKRTKIWCIASAIFTVFLAVELYIGMTHFEYNAWIILFLFFCIGKLFWRIFGIYYVGAFRADLKLQILLSPDNADPTVEFIKVPVQVITTITAASSSPSESAGEEMIISI